MLLILKVIMKGFERFPFNNIQFRFEISEISCAQWKSTFRLHRPDLSHHAFSYCSCKQDTKERYWEQQFCQMERGISVGATEMMRQVKVDHLQSCSRIFRSDQTKLVHTIWCTNRNFQDFGLNGSALYWNVHVYNNN